MRNIFCVDSGLDMVADAFESLRASHKDVKLTIIGHLRPELLAQLDRIASDPNVILIPFMEHDELLGRIANAAVCLIPYKPVADLSQIYPIKLFEYLALGAVVIASDLPNMRRVITDGENGLLFDPYDSAELVRKIELVYNDRDLGHRLAKNAEALGAEFDCKKKNEQVIQCLRKVSNI